ncbi:MAG: 4-phosphopantoate---beta-alanine ligase [Archaeoglobi archaeon]|nr:4-phosphopantoate---beta-alanine ligase [Archaeoglobi archaeon]MDK2781324.1 4-phosphopantoate---beta-alanine ligase [Archaeoglobi archaeon]
MIPKSHPRYESLMTRERLVEAVREGIVVLEGLIAHGRGEAFDYLMGEKSLPSAIEAERAAVAALLLASNPVISVNGNTAALVPSEISRLSEILGAPLEVNLFHRTEERVRKIAEHLRRHGAKRVLGLKADARIPGLEHERAKCDSDGIFSADAILVPLEDGDRCEALVGMKKEVIAIDLNPLSRTSRKATISIVDNVMRAIPRMIEMAEEMKEWGAERLLEIKRNFDNRENLRRAIREIILNLEKELEG